MSSSNKISPTDVVIHIGAALLIVTVLLLDVLDRATEGAISFATLFGILALLLRSFPGSGGADHRAGEKNGQQ